MARRVSYRQVTGQQLQYTCRDCAFSYDWHEKGADGRLFLCRCVHHKGGKYSKFLSDLQCKHFEMKSNGGTEQVG